MSIMNNEAIKNYKKTIKKIIRLNLPQYTIEEIEKGIEYSINKRFKDPQCIISNNYTGDKQRRLLSEMTNMILIKQPITTSFGVLYRHHGEVPNPLMDMIKSFMDARGIHKDKMFEFPKGSAMFEKYNLFQLLDKLDGNATYGALTNNTSIFYNINVGASIPYQGRALISSATLFFEGFLGNNVKFSSLDEVITFIYNVIEEKPSRQYDDHIILNRQITAEECFAKIVLNIGDFRKGMFKWLPDETDLDIIWSIISQLGREDLNRLFYKNNLYSFMENNSMIELLISILKNLKEPFLNCNKPPKEIKDELNTMLDVLKEYVYYKHHYIDRIDRESNMIKQIALISDTDSSIVSLDAWYRFAFEKVKGLPLEVNKKRVNVIRYLEFDEDGDLKNPTKWYHKVEDEFDYNFMTDEISEIKRSVNPFVVNQYDNLRFSIINIMGYIIGELVNDYMIEFTKSSYSYQPDRKCLIYMKNEFLFKRVLLTENKKNYASIMQVQEGHLINDGKGKMDIKGLPINKSVLNKTAKEEMKKILYRDILTAPIIDQVGIIKKLIILEKRIFQSLNSGSKEYYKPVVIKAKSSYDSPMRIQGIKAAIVWNYLKGDELESINLDERNTIDIVKVKINAKEAEKVKDKYPDLYERIQALLMNTDIFGSKSNPYKNEITSIAIPVDVSTPTWVMEFIDYITIINDTLVNFPSDSVNIETFNDNNTAYSNCMKL